MALKHLLDELDGKEFRVSKDVSLEDTIVTGEDPLHSVSPGPAETESFYNGVTFEPKAVRNSRNVDFKEVFTYNASLARLTDKGYERHPRPSEVFGFLIANLEKKLTAEQEIVAEDMEKEDYYGEWMSIAVKRSDDILTVYIDPEGLVWNDSKDRYKKIFNFSDRRDFSISGIPLNEYVELNRFNDDLVEFLYTRPFAQLPPEIREGNERALILLPPPNKKIWPVARGSISRFSFDGYYGINGRASRGVAVGMPKDNESKVDTWDDGYRSPYMTYSNRKLPYLPGIIKDKGRY
ncbi:MAG: hypothetical protein Q8Q01_05495 [archaeon]|nr:hypothetical protein [archaeon]